MKQITALLILFLTCSCRQGTKDFDKSKYSFIEELKTIAKNEDLEGLKYCLSDTIFESNDMCGFPGCSKEEFLKSYFMKSKKGKEDWKLMRQILEIGFTSLNFSKTDSRKYDSILIAPKYLNEFDWSKKLIVLSQTEIKSKPKYSSPNLFIAKKGEVYECDCCLYNQAEDAVVEESENKVWQKIKLKSNKFGYINMASTSQAFSTELEITKVNGKWRIITWFTGEPC